MIRIGTAEKLERLISIVSWIGVHDGPTQDEICDRFSIGRNELASQLTMASMVGADSEDLPPVDMYYEDDRVFVHLNEFYRPLRLTPDQGLALVVAAAGLLQVDRDGGSSPLARAVAKVADVLGLDAGEAIEVDLGFGDHDTLEMLRDAAGEHRSAEIDYWSAGRDHQTTRTVDPWQVFNDGGAWYLQAWCHLASEVRIFRIDRIAAATVVDASFAPPAELPEPLAYRAGADDPRLVVDLAPEARWVAAAYPIDAAEEMADGSLRVTMPAGAPAFLARLLLRLGPDAAVVAGEDRSDGEAVAAKAAARILARYSES